LRRSALLCSADLQNEENPLRAADFFIPGEKGWLMLGMLLKACDVSNPSRPIPVADKWNDLVYQEFYAEGDIDSERGRPVNPLHNKVTNNISKSTVGFIGFVVCPIYMTIQSFVKACGTDHANTEKPIDGVHSAQKASRREAVNAKVGTGSSYHKVLRPEGLQVYIDSLESNKAVREHSASQPASQPASQLARDTPNVDRLVAAVCSLCLALPLFQHKHCTDSTPFCRPAWLLLLLLARVQLHASRASEQAAADAAAVEEERANSATPNSDRASTPSSRVSLPACLPAAPTWALRNALALALALSAVDVWHVPCRRASVCSPRYGRRAIR
jgi:hypothetical protein